MVGGSGDLPVGTLGIWRHQDNCGSASTIGNVLIRTIIVATAQVVLTTEMNNDGESGHPITATITATPR